MLRGMKSQLEFFRETCFFQVFLNFLNNEEQTKTQVATLRRDMKNLQSELLEQRGKSKDVNSRPVDSNQNENRKSSNSASTAIRMGIQ